MRKRKIVCTLNRPGLARMRRGGLRSNSSRKKPDEDFLQHITMIETTLDVLKRLYTSFGENATDTANELERLRKQREECENKLKVLKGVQTKYRKASKEIDDLKRQLSQTQLQTSKGSRKEAESTPIQPSGSSPLSPRSAKKCEELEREIQYLERKVKVYEERLAGQAWMAGTGGQSLLTAAQCPVCRDGVLDWNKVVAYRPCGHALCGKCVAKLENRSKCPCCREPVSGHMPIYFN